MTDRQASEAPVPAVLLERRGDHIALVTLNRPQARNAINAASAQALQGIVAATEADPDIWAVVLTGAPCGTFCAGADLKEVAAGRGPELFTDPGGFAGLTDAARTKPWIAAVNGRALAGGCELVLACDLVVAAADAAFGLPEVQRGLFAAAGGAYRLPRALPRNLALEMIATGEPIDAARAHALGMVNRLVAADKVLDSAIELAAQVTRNAPVAVRESLAIARAAADLSDAELKAASAAARNRVAATDDYREGPRAFIEKRAPRWTGR